jgi:hypothetical protein
MTLQRGPGWILALLGLLLAAFVVRSQRPGDVVRGHGIVCFDNDTVRRLERMRALEHAADYPIVEVKDGFPSGSVSHWTRPMDWTIALLDPLAAPFLPQAKPNEAGAVVAGPALACLSLLVLCLGLRRLLGAGAALCAGAFYTLGYAVVDISWLGIGDHQNLQHLLLVAFAMSSLALLERKAGMLRAALGGASLGGAIWVSTESSLMLYLWCALIAAGALLRPPAAAFWRGQTAWALGLALAIAAGAAAEQRTLAALEIDKVSGLQLWQAATWLAFVALAAGLRAATRLRVLAAGAIALLAGALAAVLLGMVAPVRSQIEAFAAVNRWLQSEVAEFGNLLVDGGVFSLSPAARWFTVVVFALPLLVVGVARVALLDFRTRGTLIALALGTFALACWEMKLAHLFAIVYPPLVLLGARGLWQLAGGSAPVPAWVASTFAAVLVLAAIASLPAPYGADPQRTYHTKMALQAAAEIAADSGSRADHSVLAPWDLGAHLMYYGGQPVVASGYHRNIAGILDGNRLFLAQPEEDAQVRELLRARRVRYVIAWWAQGFVLTASRTLGRTDLARQEGSDVLFSPLARRTLFWRLRYGSVDGFELIASGPQITLAGNATPEPFYRIFRIAP